jgi:hypothetical protein
MNFRDVSVFPAPLGPTSRMIASLKNPPPHIWSSSLLPEETRIWEARERRDEEGQRDDGEPVARVDGEQPLPGAVWRAAHLDDLDGSPTRPTCSSP